MDLFVTDFQQIIFAPQIVIVLCVEASQGLRMLPGWLFL